MAAHPIVVIDDQLRARLPEEFLSDPRYRNGASLELVPISEARSGDDVLAKWDRVRGLLADSPHDPNEELEEEKRRELIEEAEWAKS